LLLTVNSRFSPHFITNQLSAKAVSKETIMSAADEDAVKNSLQCRQFKEPSEKSSYLKPQNTQTCERRELPSPAVGLAAIEVQGEHFLSAPTPIAVEDWPRDPGTAQSNTQSLPTVRAKQDSNRLPNQDHNQTPNQLVTMLASKQALGIGWVLIATLTLAILVSVFGLAHLPTARWAEIAGPAFVLGCHIVGLVLRSRGAYRQRQAAKRRMFKGPQVLGLALITLIMVGIIATEPQTSTELMLCFNPNSPSLHETRGNQRLGMGEYQQAIDDFTATIKGAPRNSSAYDGRSEAYYALDKYDAAFADANNSIRLDADNGRAFYNRAVAELALGKNQKAIDDFTRSVQLSEGIDNVYSYNGRGNAYYNLKQYKKAIADYTNSIALMHSYADSYSSRGDSYRQLKQYHSAVSDYTKTIQLDPDNGYNYYYRAIAYEKLGKKALAEKDQLKAKQLRFEPDVNE
jgi:lipoprotein NlpI